MKKITIIIIFFCIYNLIDAQENNHRDSVDVVHYQIHIDFSNLESKQLKGNTLLKITAKKNELKSIALDLLGLEIDRVLLNNKEKKFTYNSKVLRINTDKIYTKKDTFNLNIYYHGTPKHDKSWGGFFITSSFAFNYGVGMAAQPPNYGRVWYPCIDNFTDKATYEYFITVKNKHTAVCSGTLMSVKTSSNKKLKTYHWQLHQAIPTYISSIAVADYVAIKDTVKGLKRIIPIEIYVNKKDKELGKITFAHVKDFFHAYENAYGAYRWEKIGYVATPFKNGAMEHATNIAYGANCNGNTTCEYTLAHELSHHWFGDLVTCRTEKDMWLNEGWAVFSEAVFEEYMYGKQAYKNYIRKKHKRVLQYAHLLDRSYLPVYGIPHKFTYGETVYRKGGIVAHTLRGYIGDSLFFNTLKQYFKDYAFKDISTIEFKEYFSKKSGENLDDFFDFWVFNPGFPHFLLDNYNIKKDNNKYQLDFTIIQQLIGTDKYARNLKLEVGILDKNWKINKYTIKFTGKSEIKKIKLDYKPLLFMIDPDEKIADATTDEYLTIKKTGKIEFNEEFFNLNTKQITDSTFFRIIHNWIQPTYNYKNTTNYIFADRYWEIQYINKNIFEAEAEFSFNLSYRLDKNLSKYNQTDIILLYRKNNKEKWQKLDKNITKKNNKFIVDKIIAGQYCIAFRK